MSNAGKLFVCSFPTFPNDDAGDYLRNKKSENDCCNARSKKPGNDEAEAERAGNHESREGPKLTGGAGDEWVAVNKHGSGSDQGKPRGLVKVLADAAGPHNDRPFVCQCLSQESGAGGTLKVVKVTEPQPQSDQGPVNLTNTDLPRWS